MCEPTQMCEPTVVALLADHRIRQRTASIAKASSPASRPLVLAALRALRLDPTASAARPNAPETTRKTVTTTTNPP
jgi:hypothetical protein